MRSACQRLGVLVLLVASGAHLSNLWSTNQLSNDVGDYRPPHQEFNLSLLRTKSGGSDLIEPSSRATSVARSSVIHVAALFKVHSLDLSTRARLDHLISDLALGGPHYVNAHSLHQRHQDRNVPDRKYSAATDSLLSRARQVLTYHIAVLYDAPLLNASEVAELESIMQRVNGRAAMANEKLHANATAIGLNKASEDLAATQGIIVEKVFSLFPFTAAAMHALYPTQYPKSDFQAPKSPWKKAPLQGRLRHITHDNPEFAYLLWWQDQLSKVQPRGHYSVGLMSAQMPWRFVWGIEYDVACSGSWRRFMADACVLDPLMSNADLLGTMVGSRPWSTWTLGGRINFGRATDLGSNGVDRRVGMYAPLVRFTPHALDLLHEGYSSGRVGYVEVAMSTTCAIANDAAYNNALDKNTSGSRRKHQAIDEEFTEKMPEESHGCKMANISAQWLGHFDYRPVIEPEVVWPQLVLAKPNLLWHPVKASKPLSSNLLDKAYSKISINESQEVLSANRNPRPSHEGSNVAPKNFISTSASQEPAPFMRSILEKPRSYKPLEYFLSGTHVPWS